MSDPRAPTHALFVELHGHRYRNGLQIETTSDAGRFQLVPYAHAEALYDLNDNVWPRLR